MKSYISDILDKWPHLLTGKYDIYAKNTKTQLKEMKESPKLTIYMSGMSSRALHSQN